MKNLRLIILAIIFIFGTFYFVRSSEIPPGYVETVATVLEHRGSVPGLGSNRVARVAFNDLLGIPKEGNTYDEIMFGMPRVGEKISIYHSPSDPSIIRIASPINRKLELLVAFAIFMALFAIIKLKKNEA